MSRLQRGYPYPYPYPCSYPYPGRMSTRVLPYLAALHIRERPVYLAALLPGDVAPPTRPSRPSLPGSPKKRVGNDW